MPRYFAVRACREKEREREARGETRESPLKRRLLSRETFYLSDIAAFSCEGYPLKFLDRITLERMPNDRFLPAPDKASF